MQKTVGMKRINQLIRKHKKAIKNLKFKGKKRQFRTIKNQLKIIEKAFNVKSLSQITNGANKLIKDDRNKGQQIQHLKTQLNQQNNQANGGF